MSCGSYKFMHDEYEVCYRKPDDECSHGYDSCYCQGDENCCPLPYDGEEEVNMIKELILDKLKAYLEPLIHFGTLELKISDSNYGKKIEVFERDEYTYEDGNGESIHDGDLTRPFALIIDKEGIIGFIEHPYGAFTMANKDEVKHVVGLIGMKVNL